MLLPGLKRASARGQIEARDFSSSRCLLRRAGGRPADAWDCPHGVHRASGLDNLIRANTLSPPIHLSIHLCMDVRPQGVITPLFGRRGRRFGLEAVIGRWFCRPHLASLLVPLRGTPLHLHHSPALVDFPYLVTNPTHVAFILSNKEECLHASLVPKLQPIRKPPRSRLRYSYFRE